MLGGVGEKGLGIVQGNGFLGHVMGTDGFFTEIDFIQIVDVPCGIDEILFDR